MQRPVTQKILMQIYGIQAFVDIEPDLISQGTDKAFSPVISCSKACIYFLQVFATPSPCNSHNSRPKNYP